MPTTFPTSGHGWRLSPRLRHTSPVLANMQATLPEGNYASITLPKALFFAESANLADFSLIQNYGNRNDFEQVVCYLHTSELVNHNNIGAFTFGGDSGLAHPVYTHITDNAEADMMDSVRAISRRALVFHMRHNLHIPLTHIAACFALHTSGSYNLPTANSIGSEYVTICRNLGITPYRSVAQQNASIRATGRTTVREIDEDMNELPSYLLATDIQMWFNSRNYSFGTETELVGLSVNTAHHLVMQMPDIEVLPNTAYGHANFSQWKVVPDGSVSRGAEIVSPVLRFHEGFLTLRRVLVALKRGGGRISGACGGHVHFGVEHLTPSDRARIIEGHQMIQPLFDAFVLRGRLNNSYCRSRSASEASLLAERMFTNAGREGQDVSGGTCNRGEVGSIGRYFNLNIASWMKYGTFENRQLEGCLNPRKMFAWLCLNMAFMSACEQPDLFSSGEGWLATQLLTGRYNTPEAMFALVAHRTGMPQATQDLITSMLRSN